MGGWRNGGGICGFYGPIGSTQFQQIEARSVSAIYLDIIRDFLWDLARVDSHTVCTTSDYIKPPQVGKCPREKERERERERESRAEGVKVGRYLRLP